MGSPTSSKSKMSPWKCLGPLALCHYSVREIGVDGTEEAFRRGRFEAAASG